MKESEKVRSFQFRETVNFALQIIAAIIIFSYLFYLKEANIKLKREMKMREALLDRETSLRRAKMEASAAEGISWGMGEDAIEEDEVIMTQDLYIRLNYLIIYSSFIC